MIGSFAGMVFETSDDRVLTMTGLKKDVAARYTQHDVIGGKPLVEFLGPDLGAISFTMILSAQLGVSPTAEIKKLENFIRSGRNSRFVLGGRNLGRYNAVSMSESYEVITERGLVVSARVDLSLKEYN